MADRKDPYRNSRFKLEIGGIIQAGFSEATVPDTSTDVVEYREGDEPARLRKLPGLTKYANITLKWGVTDSMEIFTWRQQVIDGQMKKARRSVAIIVCDEEGNDAVRWEFERAWPSKFDPSDLNAKGNDVAVDSLEIVHEGMKRTK